MFHISIPRFVLFFGIFFFTVGGINAQVINPRVNGLNIGAKYPAIVKKLGRSISDKCGGDAPCGETMRTLRYDGLVLRLEIGGTNR